MTRERLYLESMQQVLSNTSKVMVTGDKGQNNLLYLPLDKMIEGRRGAAQSGASSSTSSDSGSSQDSSSRSMRDTDPRDLRSRESR